MKKNIADLPQPVQDAIHMFDLHGKTSMIGSNSIRGNLFGSDYDIEDKLSGSPKQIEQWIHHEFHPSKVLMLEFKIQKGNKKFPNGWQVSIRWHDAGDFFSKDYLDMTLKLAQQFPDVKFYAYTKMANAALSEKLPNFIINWSEGAKSAQAKQVKAQDPNLEHTKNSRIVPQDMFWDLLKKDEKGNLDKEGADEEGEGGRWVTRDPAATKELKQRLAKEYGISVNSILNYDEYLAKRNSIPQGMKYNVIVAPGEGDISAADRGVLSTLLLKHGNA